MGGMEACSQKWNGLAPKNGDMNPGWKLTNVIPISNRWVFIRKYNKKGDLLKYKGRLVVKGCAQQPGHDYQETYAPVVRMEKLRVILASVAGA